MTRQEFEERTNLQVKEEDFDAIHEVYMTTDHDKRRRISMRFTRST